MASPTKDQWDRMDPNEITRLMEAPAYNWRTLHDQRFSEFLPRQTAFNLRIYDYQCSRGEFDLLQRELANTGRIEFKQFPGVCWDIKQVAEHSSGYSRNRHQQIIVRLQEIHRPLAYLDYNDYPNQKETDPMKSGMNATTALFLANDSLKAYRAVYEALDGNGKPVAGDVPKLFKSFETFAKDDLVIVTTTTRHNFTVAKIYEVDVDVDFTSDEVARWIVGKIDTTAHDSLVSQENRAMALMLNAEKLAQKKALQAKMTDFFEAAKTEKLQIVGPTAPDAATKID